MLDVVGETMGAQLRGSHPDPRGRRGSYVVSREGDDWVKCPAWSGEGAERRRRGDHQ
jgi:hypothetical protein